MVDHYLIVIEFAVIIVEPHGQVRGTTVNGVGANTPHREPSAQTTIHPRVNS